MDQSHFVCHIGERPEGCHHRPRRCLLKGCERLFWPRRPQARYCSEACCRSTRHWRCWQASQRYRASDSGRERRRDQARRYRQRLRERQIASADVDLPGEGQRQPAKIFRRGGANGRAAMNISRSSMNIRASDFAVWRAAWRCVACWIVRRVIGRGTGACVVSA